MAIIKFTNRPFPPNPWTEFEEMKNEMERLARTLSSSRQRYSDSSAFPALNISEDDTNIYVRARMPGIAPADAEIFLEGETLTLKGEREPLTKNIKSYHRNEIAHGHFNRTITLPCKVVSDRISATTSNGILMITLPKAKPARPQKIVVTQG
jgi:HSP20 family protein